MRKFAMWLMLASVCSAQQINPNQIQPAGTSGYVLTTVTAGQPPSWQPSTGSGSGTINPAYEYLMPTYVIPGINDVLGAALNFAAFPDTLTPALKSTYLNSLPTYSGDAILTTSGESSPSNPYSHAPFQNNNGIAIIGDRTDVPKQPTYVKDYGAQCDAGAQLISTTIGSNQVTLSSPSGNAPGNAVVAGMSIGVVGFVSGVPTAWEPIITSVSGSTATTFDNAPFTVTSAPAVYGHDDTVYIQTVWNDSVGLPGGVYGKPTLPGGTCLVHTLIMSGGPSLQGQGIASDLEGFPGEDVIALSDPNNPPAGIGYHGQTAVVQDNDFHITLNTYLNAVGTLGTSTAWRQVVTLPSVPTGSCIEGNFTGCSTTTNTFAYDSLNRHWGRRSPWANNPLGPGWCAGDDQADGGLCIASVGAVTNGSATICIPSAAPQPLVTDTVVFPYLVPTFKTTLGSQTTCTGGTQFTMGATYPGATSSQAEFMAGTAFQSLNAGINSSATQFVGNLNVHPQWFATDNVGSHGLVQIDSEQLTYRVVVNQNNTFLNLVRGVNGTTAASHSTNALIVPLNPVNPATPWPVIPSLAVGTSTTPAGAEFYPAGAIGNAAYAMPLLSGANLGAGFGDGSYVRNLTIDTVGGVNDTTNNTAGFWITQLPYSTMFDRIFITGTYAGQVDGPPKNNYAYNLNQTSCNATTWNKVTIRSVIGWYNLCGGQATYSNFDIYNTAGVVGYAQWQEPNDQTPVVGGQFGGQDTLSNIYNEDTGAGYDGVGEPEDAFYASGDTLNTIDWLTGNIVEFVGNGNVASNLQVPNGSVYAPLIIYGSGNRLINTGAVGPVTQNSNVWGTGTVLNYGNLGGNNVDGTDVGGSYLNTSLIGTGSRAVAGLQTGESAFLGNVTPTNQVLDLNSGIIYPGEINVKGSGRPTGMDGIVTDSNAPFNGAVYCKGSSTSCVPQYWVPCDQNCGLSVAIGSRIVPATYTVYIPYRTNTGTPTEVIALQVWTGGTATTVASSTVTNSTSWQILEFDNVNLASYSGYTLGISTGTFSSSSANYYVGGVEFIPIGQKMILQNLTVLGTCTGCGSGSSGVTSVIPGTNVTCSPLASGSCVGNVTINATGGGGGALTVGTTTVTGGASGNVLSEVSGVLQSLSPTITINSVPCSLGGTCTVAGGGGGSITSVIAGTNLSGGGSSGAVTLNVIASPSFTTTKETGNITASSGGAYQMYNVASSTETDFVNNPGASGGGFNFYNTTSGGTLGTPITTIDASGNLTVLGTGTFDGSGSPGLTLAPTGTATSGTPIYNSVPLAIEASFYSGTAQLSTWNIQSTVFSGSGFDPNLEFSGPANIATNNNVVFKLDPSISATSSVNYDAPVFLFKGDYWNGSASAIDTWYITPALGAGTNPTSMLTYSHSGSSGTAAVVVPNLTITGTCTGCPGGGASTNTGYAIPGSRAIGTVYQNTGSTARWVAVTLTGTSGFINAYVNAATFTPPSGNVLASMNSAAAGSTVGFWVLPGFYYALYTTGTFSANEWWEFQL